MRPARPTLLLVTMSVGYFLVLFDVSALTVALPLLRLDLRADTGSLSAVVAGYAVPFAALLLAAGVAGDRLGHLRHVRFGLTGFGWRRWRARSRPPWRCWSRHGWRRGP